MFLIALSPILWLIIALSVLKMAAYKACPIALVIALAAGIFVNDMTIPHAVEATLEGVALACWPILLVIIAAIFTYNLTLQTKAMDTIKKMLTSVSNDRRVLILLIGWGFGGFLEGMAGFGTAIAIPAGMLAGIGINPVLAAMVCLIANSVPTAYGSIGIPIVTLGNVTGIDPIQLATYTALQLAPLTILCPFLMVIVASHSLKGQGHDAHVPDGWRWLFRRRDGHCHVHGPGARRRRRFHRRDGRRHRLRQAIPGQ